MASQWIPPLPAGFEARWDPNQRAYFFINHRDKSTTWQDPRFNQPQSNAHHAAAQDQGKKVDVEKLHKLTEMFPSAPQAVVHACLLRNDNVEFLTTKQLAEAGYRREEVARHPAPKVVDMTERLRAMFPTANQDLIGDILSQSNNDEKQARVRLEAIGYKASFPQTHKDRSRSKSPAAKSPTKKPTSPARRASPAKPTMSAAEKHRLVNKIKGQFPRVDKSVVEMALESCNYDESRVKTVLTRMTDTSRPSSSRPTTSTSTSRGKSTSPTPPNISHGLDPVVFSDDTSSRPSTASTGNKSRSTTPTSRPQSSSRSSTPKSTAQQKTQRAKQVTHGRSKTVVSKQPTGSGSNYTSANRTIPKGPDPSNAQGPNKYLLLDAYTQARGSNPELCQGPDPGRVQGSNGATGPDRTMHCGPQVGLHQGAEGRNLLVTAI